jgi:hypothetical protein
MKEFLEVAAILSPFYAQLFLAGAALALAACVLFGIFFSYMKRAAQEELRMVIPGARQEFLTGIIPTFRGLARKSWGLSCFFSVTLIVAMLAFRMVYGVPIPQL